MSDYKDYAECSYSRSDTSASRRGTSKRHLIREKQITAIKNKGVLI